MCIIIPVSLGELVDKITILEIKMQRISNPEALQNIKKELDALKTVKRPIVSLNLVDDLRDVNMEIWDVEDELRECERRQDFGETFVVKARSVYVLNDKRAFIKRKMNIHSEFKEEKSYSVY